MNVRPVFYWLFITSLILGKTGFGQSGDGILIKGNIYDSLGHPVPNVSSLLIKVKDSSIYRSAFTDSMGAFELKAVRTGVYKLSVQSRFYRPYSVVIRIDSNSQSPYTVPAIRLTPSPKQLSEVIVRGDLPLIERRADRIVFNVQNNPLVAGQSLMDVLGLLPGVIIDAQDNINLNGKSGVAVMMNDKAVRLSGQQLINYLRSLSSSNVSNIEIISNPSAKFDAEGSAGIIKINSKKVTQKGYSGNISAGYYQGRYDNYTTEANLNYKSNKVNLLFGYNYSNWLFASYFDESRRFLINNTTQYFNEHSTTTSRSYSHMGKAGISYDFDKQNSLSAYSELYFNDAKKIFDGQTLSTTQKVDSGFNTAMRSTIGLKKISTTVAFHHAFDKAAKNTLDINYDYFYYPASNTSNYTIHYFDSNYQPSRNPYNLTIDNPGNIYINSVKADYSGTLKTLGHLEAGLKTSIIKTNFNINYLYLLNNIFLKDSDKTNLFNYSETINAGYVNWKKDIKKWSLQAGVRVEQTISKGDAKNNVNIVDRRYTRVFPSAFIQYSISNASILNLSYSARITRPDYNSLNTFEYYSDPYSVQTGNPYLRPELTNSYEFSYTLKNKYIFTLGYRHSENVIKEFTTQNDVTRMTTLYPENFKYQNNISVTASAPVQLAKWWRLDVNSNYFYNNYVFYNSNLHNKLNTFTGSVTNSVNLPKKVLFSLQGYYRSPLITGIERYSSMYKISAGLQRRFVKDKLLVRLNVADLFRSQRDKILIQYENQYTPSLQTYDSRRVSISINYRFLKGVKFRKMEVSDNLEDEKSRSGQ